MLFGNSIAVDADQCCDQIGKLSNERSTKRERSSCAPSGLLCSRMAHLGAEACRNLLSVVKLVLIIVAVILTTANRAYAAHSGAECYLHGHRIYVPDGLNYPRQAWAGWGISCRTEKPEIAAGSGAIGADSGERPADWCGWWMRQHLGGRYGPEFNVARNWLNAGRPLDGPRPGAIGVKAHHVFQVIRVVDRDHVLAISGNDHNDVRTRIRPTSDVIGWRDITGESTAADKPAADTAPIDKTAADKVGSDKSVDDTSAQGP